MPAPDNHPARPIDVGALADLSTPWTLHVVATLSIAEHLAAGVTRLEDLAAATSADAGVLGRVLRHLVGRGVFEEPAPGHFRLNEPAKALLDPGLRLVLNLDGFGGRMAGAWNSLLTAVRTGAPVYHGVFGRPFWEDLDAHPDIAADFDALMGPAGHGTPDPEILAPDDWASIGSVVDVGGGTGSLLVEILRANPSVRGTLVDRPATIARAQDTFRGAGMADRVATIAQSFFDVLPAGADLYVLKNVLADWPDREAEDLLRRVADAARPAGRVVILGGVCADEAGEPSPELLMIVLVGGKERTLTEFGALARRAGLGVAATRRQPTGRFVVECRPIVESPRHG